MRGETRLALGLSRSRRDWLRRLLFLGASNLAVLALCGITITMRCSRERQLTRARGGHNRGDCILLFERRSSRLRTRNNCRRAIRRRRCHAYIRGATVACIVIANSIPIVIYSWSTWLLYTCISCTLRAHSAHYILKWKDFPVLRGSYSLWHLITSDSIARRRKKSVWRSLKGIPKVCKNTSILGLNS